VTTAYSYRLAENSLLPTVNEGEKKLPLFHIIKELGLQRA